MDDKSKQGSLLPFRYFNRHKIFENFDTSRKNKKNFQSTQDYSLVIYEVGGNLGSRIKVPAMTKINLLAELFDTCAGGRQHVPCGSKAVE